MPEASLTKFLHCNCYACAFIWILTLGDNERANEKTGDKRNSFPQNDSRKKNDGS